MAVENKGGISIPANNMMLYTNENNSSTLKVLIAAKLAGRKLDVKISSLSDEIVPGPRQLPLMVVNEELAFFSSNAAVSYLLPINDSASNSLSQQWLEWEATRLRGAVYRVLQEKASVELQASISALMQHLDSGLKTKYLCGDSISAADISVWSALHLLHGDDKYRTKYFTSYPRLIAWYRAIDEQTIIQEAVKDCALKSCSPSDTSQLGTPLAPCLASPAAEAPTVLSSDELRAAEEAWGETYVPSVHPDRKLVLPVKGERNVLITSALPYVNNIPHLGNIIGCVLSADIFARYCRCMGYNTLFICGTDEYGTATETKALEENLTPRQICDKYFEIHNDVYRWFNIGFDYFGRTSTPEHTEITQRAFLKLNENGFITSQSVDQLLCTKCDRFLADRFVEGTCPHPGCGYEDARGDQCDKCGKLVTATELVRARCKLCATAPTLTQSKQFFLELPSLEPKLRAWVALSEGAWSGSARAVARSWLRDGLRARCITRDLKWGVPVPLDGYRDKVFYVWFDAPIGYMSITKRYTAEYEKWWRPDPDTKVQFCQFMAKDNIPFHAIIFPAMLMGINENHVLVSSIFATEYLNYEEGKFSKSRGVGVFGNDAQNTEIPADVWRFYLACVRPEGQDSSFSWAELGTRNNSELLNNLGNFCHRSLSFCKSSFGGTIPEMRPRAQHLELFALVNREIAAYVENMERGKLREGLKHVLAISRLGNQHMQSEQPWTQLKGENADRERAETTIGVCCNVVALLCTLLAPFTPETSGKLAAQLGVDRERLRLKNCPRLRQFLPPGHSIGQPAPLFSKIEPARLEELRAKYAGTQAQRSAKENGEEPARLCAADLEAEIAKQGDKVRQLKASTKDKAAWTPEVNRLLELKKQLAALQTAKSTPERAEPTGGQDVASLTEAVAMQGEKVRQLKASTKDKTVWAPEVDRLLELKKQLAALQIANSTPERAEPTGGQDVASLTEAIAKQGDKVRQLKASTKDKAAWTPEVNRLLELKKQLAALQTK